MTSLDSPPPVCSACRRPVIRNRGDYEVFEGMHWACFHFEFEHSVDGGDVDTACADPACPARAHDPDPMPSWLEGAPEAPRLPDDEVDPETGRTRGEHLRARRADPSFWQPLLELDAAGKSTDAALEKIAEVTRDFAPKLAAELHAGAPVMLREHRRYHEGFARRLREVWGSALDAMYEIYVCVEELGSDLQQVHGPSGDLLFDVVAGLHARACLVLLEVHTLLSQGFAHGGLARARTLHEISVVARTLNFASTQAGAVDVVSRYVEHLAVDEARDFSAALASGLSVDEQDREAITRRRDHLVEKYGYAFGFDYGWAAPLFPDLRTKDRVSLPKLETLLAATEAKLDLRISSHHVHASARSISLNMYEFRGQEYRLTGPTNSGLGPAAALALDAAVEGMVALVFSQPSLPDPMDLVAVQALSVVVEQAIAKFDAAQETVERLERLAVGRPED